MAESSLEPESKKRKSGRKAKSPAFQWYPSDAASDEKYAPLTCLEVGAFHLLLNYQWLNGPLPDDAAILARLCKLDAQDFQRVWPMVGRCFPVFGDGKRASPRLEAEREFQAENREARVKAGSRGNAARWSSQTDRNAIANGSQLIAPVSLLPSPDTRDPTPGLTTPQPPPLSGEGGTASKRERTPEQKAKDAEKAKHREAGKRVWQEAWAEHRDGSEPFEFADKHSTILRRIHEKHGSEKLRAKCDALLSDMEPWVHKNASPSLLATRWSQLGQATPRRMTQAELNVQETMAAADEIDAIEARAAARRNGQ